MAHTPAMANFFNSEHFAVVGASKDRSKIGNKVMLWYKEHGLDVVPVHPKESSIEEVRTIASVFDINAATSTSVSIITPGHVTLPVIKTALLELGTPFVWLQPGAENEDVVSWIKEQPEEVQERIIYGGPCILVSGEGLLKEKGKL